MSNKIGIGYRPWERRVSDAIAEELKAELGCSDEYACGWADWGSNLLLDRMDDIAEIERCKKLLGRATRLLEYYNAEVRRRGSEAPDVDAVLAEWECMKVKAMP